MQIFRILFLSSRSFCLFVCLSSSMLTEALLIILKKKHHMIITEINTANFYFFLGQQCQCRSDIDILYPVQARVHRAPELATVCPDAGQGQDGTCRNLATSGPGSYHPLLMITTGQHDKSYILIYDMTILTASLVNPPVACVCLCPHCTARRCGWRVTKSRLRQVLCHTSRLLTEIYTADEKY